MGGIYAAALEPREWPEALRRAAEGIGASSAFFFSAHSDTDRDAVCHAHNHSPEMVRDFFRHWHAHDAWAQRAPAKGVRAGQVVRGSELLDDRELTRTAFYGDFLRKHEVGRMVGSVLFDGTGPEGLPFTHMCWYRPPGREEFDGRASAQVQGWVGHVQQALRIQRRLGWLSDTEGEPALDALYVASMLLDERGAIQHCNEPAQALLASLPAGCVRFGRLRSIGLRCAPSVADALASCRPARPVRLAAYLGGERPQVVHATMLDVSGSMRCPLPGQHGPRYLLLLELPRVDGRQVAEAVAPLFGLSPAETRVLGGLLQGRPPGGIAQACGTSVATVRTQISSILTKTGCNGQTELLLLLRGMRF